MDDFIIKYRELRREAYLRMIAGDLKGYIKKLTEMESIQKLFRRSRKS